MRKYASATVTSYCQGCGEPRLLTRRQARRAGLCNRCLYPPRDVAIDDRYRRFWFDRFNDQELSLIASELAGYVVPSAGIARQRQALVAAGSIQPAKGVQSAGERQPSTAALSPPR